MKGIWLIAKLYRGKALIGYRLLDCESKKVKDIPYKGMIIAMRKGAKVENAELHIDVDDSVEIVGTNGILSRYPNIIDGKPDDVNKVIILERIEDKGFIVCNCNGIIKCVKKEVLANSKVCSIANGKVVEKDGEFIVSSIKGEYDIVELNTAKESKQADSISNVPQKEEVDKPSGDNLDKIEEELKNAKSQKPISRGIRECPEGVKEMCDDGKNTVEGRITKAMMVIKRAKPFYFSTLGVVKKVPVRDCEIGTMAVDNAGNLFYNVDFVKSISLNMTISVLMHEVYHIVMGHAIRQRGRQHLIWNIATDAYINESIFAEYPNGITRYEDVNKQRPSNIYKIELEGCVRMDGLDLAKTTPEAIYSILIKEYENAYAQAQGSGQDSDEGGQGSDEDGQGSGSAQSYNGNGNGQSSGQGSDEDEQGSNGKGQGSGIGQGSDEDEQDSDEDVTNADGSVDAVKLARKIGKNSRKFDETAKKIGDLIDNGGDESKADSVRKNIISRALEDAKRSTGGSGVGTGTGGLERYAEDVVAPKVDWRRALNGKLTKADTYYKSFKRPNRKYIAKGIYVQGNIKNAPNKLGEVKLCFDTSGSVSDEDLSIAIAQCKELLKKFGTTGQIIYWDGDVSSYQDVSQYDAKTASVVYRPTGGGGTDPCVVYEWLESKECEREAEVVVMFTDGYFDTQALLKYKKKWADKTIWVITDSGDRNMPFGVVAKLNLDK